MQHMDTGQWICKSVDIDQITGLGVARMSLKRLKNS